MFTNILRNRIARIFTTPPVLSIVAIMVASSLFVSGSEISLASGINSKRDGVTANDPQSSIPNPQIGKQSRTEYHNNDTTPLLSDDEKVRLRKFFGIPDIDIPDEWEKYIYPAYEEFWKEGNHLPDAGIVLWGRDPTPEKAKLYLIRYAIKRNATKKLQEQSFQANLELIHAGLIADDYNFATWTSFDKKANKYVVNSKNTSSSSPLKFDRSLFDDHNIFFLFASWCKFCEKQSQILLNASNVIPIQVDVNNDTKNFHGLPESNKISASALDKYLPECATKNSDCQFPTLIIYNKNKKTYAKLRGVQTISQIVETMNKLRSK